MGAPNSERPPEWKRSRFFSAEAKGFWHHQRESEDVWKFRLEAEAKNDKNVHQKIV